MRKAVIGFTLSTLLLALCHSAAAQQLKKIPGIGLLFPGSQSVFAIWTEAFRQGLRELGIRDSNSRH